MLLLGKVSTVHDSTEEDNQKPSSAWNFLDCPTHLFPQLILVFFFFLL
jgi:hypothetical protein